MKKTPNITSNFRSSATNSKQALTSFEKAKAKPPNSIENDIQFHLETEAEELEQDITALEQVVVTLENTAVTSKKGLPFQNNAVSKDSLLSSASSSRSSTLDGWLDSHSEEIAKRRTAVTSLRQNYGCWVGLFQKGLKRDKQEPSMRSDFSLRGKEPPFGRSKYTSVGKTDDSGGLKAKSSGLLHRASETSAMGQSFLHASSALAEKISGTTSKSKSKSSFSDTSKSTYVPEESARENSSKESVYSSSSLGGLVGNIFLQSNASSKESHASASSSSSGRIVPPKIKNFEKAALNNRNAEANAVKTSARLHSARGTSLNSARLGNSAIRVSSSVKKPVKKRHRIKKKVKEMLGFPKSSGSSGSSSAKKKKKHSKRRKVAAFLGIVGSPFKNSSSSYIEHCADESTSTKTSVLIEKKESTLKPETEKKRSLNSDPLSKEAETACREKDFLEKKAKLLGTSFQPKKISKKSDSSSAVSTKKDGLNQKKSILRGTDTATASSSSNKDASSRDVRITIPDVISPNDPRRVHFSIPDNELTSSRSNIAKGISSPNSSTKGKRTWLGSFMSNMFSGSATPKKKKSSRFSSSSVTGENANSAKEKLLSGANNDTENATDDIHNTSMPRLDSPSHNNARYYPGNSRSSIQTYAGRVNAGVKQQEDALDELAAITVNLERQATMMRAELEGQYEFELFVCFNYY